MTAPVSLAAIKAEIVAAGCGCPCETCKAMRCLAPLVELAEAYLAVRALDPTYGADIQKGREYADARARLALAAKGVAR